MSSGGIAQLVEQMTFNHWVQSSSLCASTKKIKPLFAVLFFCAGTRTTEFDYEFVFANEVPRTQYECGAGIYAEPVSVPPPKN